MRSGNKHVTLLWTASPGTNDYDILRRATGSGGAHVSIGTTTSTTFGDANAVNGTGYDYVVTARSDPDGNCSSVSSSEVKAPACVVMSSGQQQLQLSGPLTEWCVVSCNDISAGSGYAKAFECGSRSFYFNGASKTCNVDIKTPAKVNGGYAYYLTAASSGGFVGVQWGNGSAAACP